MASKSTKTKADPPSSPSEASTTTPATAHTHSLAAFDRLWTLKQKQALLKPLNTTLIVKQSNSTEHKLMLLTGARISPVGVDTVLNWMRANCNSARNIPLDPSGTIITDIATFHALETLGMPHADHFFTSLMAMVGNRFLSAVEINAVWSSFQETPKMAKHLIHNVAHKVYFQYDKYREKDWLNIENAMPNDLWWEINQVGEAFGAREEGAGAVSVQRGG